MKKVLPHHIVYIKKLREQGWSLPEITKDTGFGYGTIYRHIKNTAILPEYKQIWHQKRGGSIKRKIQAEKYAGEKASKTITSLSKNEKLILLSALYWGEGSKKDFGLSNTDPSLIKIVIILLKELFQINNEDLRISIRIYDDMDRAMCLTFWSSVVEIPVEKFVNVNILKGKKLGKLPFGMCRVRIRKGGSMLKYIKAVRNQLVMLIENNPRSSTDRAQVS